jgi:CelD/BcsL family acetyltransferase involved in cellulose biosynthesis
LLQLVLPGSFAELDSVWARFESEADGSFFQSWHWIGAWLRCLPAEIEPWIARISTPTELAGLGVVVFCRKRRRAVVVSGGVYLNETGDDRLDNITIEHNGILAMREQREAVQDAFIRQMLEQRSGWDELFISGADERADWPSAPLNARGLHFRVLRDRPNYRVSLQHLTPNIDGYLEKLSSNTRYQIRRAMRKYEESAGPLTVQAACSREEALEFLDGLKGLHQQYWIARGQPGSFSDPFFERFHRDLINTSFAAGVIQMLRIAAGSTVVGYLYNFVYRGTVSNYQSGLCYDGDAALKPGMVAHVLAVNYNVRARLETYEFLAGDQQYKRSLATDEKRMYWLVGQKRRAKYLIEDATNRLVRRLRALRERRSHAR